MPGATGLDLARHVVATELGTPVILMTGDPSVVSSTSGVLAVLDKPVDVDRLDELLRACVRDDG